MRRTSPSAVNEVVSGLRPSVPQNRSRFPSRTGYVLYSRCGALAVNNQLKHRFNLHRYGTLLLFAVNATIAIQREDGHDVYVKFEIVSLLLHRIHALLARAAGLESIGVDVFDRNQSQSSYGR